MIYNFPCIYKDELIYSVIGRYHKYSGNTNLRYTLLDFFDTINIIPTLEFQSHLNQFINNLKNKVDIDTNEVIENNTLIPLYSCFTRKDRINKIKRIMANSDGKSIKYKIGMIRSGICKKDYINYCPICSKEEMHKYGETYIHRTHQVQGVLVCEKHGCLLRPYIVNPKIQEYIVLDKKNMNFNIEYPKHGDKEKLVRIAKDIYFLLNNSKKYYVNDIKNTYNFLIYKKGLANKKGRVNQIELKSQFINHYGKEFLEALESNVDENNKFNWLSSIVRKHSKTFHPLRHILFIDFLCGNINNFMNQMEINHKSDIDRPWLCLNPCCKNYRKPVIKDYKIIIDSKSKGTIGIFKCDCGFVYSRKITGDLNHIGRVRRYGRVWEAKLKELVNSNMSIRAIARKMICDPTTVVKYAEKLGVKQLLNTKRGTLYKETTNVNYKTELKNKYRDEVIKIISLDPNISRNDIRKKLIKEYKWLYKYDKEWFEKNLPIVKIRNTNARDYSEYWDKKDNEALLLVKNTYSILINMDKPIRITKSLIGTRIHKRALITKKIDKIPKTKKFLESVCESLDEFRFRRLDKIYTYIYEEKVEIPEWKILKMASIKDKLILEKYKLSRTKIYA
jgi:transposase-like protein